MLLLPIGFMAPGPSIAAAVGPALVMASPAYATGTPSGFGRMLTAGSGLAASGLAAPSGNYTFECWFRAAAPSGGTEMLPLVNSDATTGIAVHATGPVRLLVGGYAAVGTTNVCDGAFHHLAAAFNAGASSTQVYVDGVLDINYGFAATANYVMGVRRAATLESVFEARVSNILRYGANFTRPAAPFVPDGSTIGLWHLDGNGLSA